MTDERCLRLDVCAAAKLVTRMGQMSRSIIWLNSANTRH
jgi:hypothetical protein